MRDRSADVALNQNLIAITNVLIGTAVFALFFASGKFAGDAASALQIVFLRYIGGFLSVLSILYLRDGKVRHCIGRSTKSHFLRAVAGCFGGVAIIHASGAMPIVDATSISLLNVVFVIPLGVIFLGERILSLQWLGIVLATLGAAVMMAAKGAFQTLDIGYLVPSAIALAGAMLLAVEGILIRVLSRSDNAISVLLHVNFFGFLLMAIPAALTWQSADMVFNASLMLWGPVAITAQYFIIRGYRLADVSIVGPVDYSWLIFAAALGYIFFGEVPSFESLLGAVLIGTGGVVLCLVRQR